MHPSFVALGEMISAPLYDKYFRCLSYGHENIPATGPAIIAANHSGNVPVDGLLIWLDVVRNTVPTRVARPIADHFVPSLPYIGTLFSRGGMVGGSVTHSAVIENQAKSNGGGLYDVDGVYDRDPRSAGEASSAAASL